MMKDNFAKIGDFGCVMIIDPEEEKQEEIKEKE